VGMRKKNDNFEGRVVMIEQPLIEVGTSSELPKKVKLQKLKQLLHELESELNG